MSLAPAQQFQELLKKSLSPIILLPSYPSRDSVSSAFALFFFLKNTRKDVVIAGDELEKVARELEFLGKPDALSSTITGARDFVLSFDITRNKIGNVRTEATEEELRIYLTPDHGSIDPRDFSFIPAKFKYDLAIVIGAPDKEHMGKIYEDNPDIFYEIPIVNIDNHAENELFGQINLVELTASSTAEIVADVLEKILPEAIDEQVSECLLTGLIAATESFQKKNTTPRSLEIASRLMAKGADQQKIIRALYRTQPFHLLKLWGRTMAEIQWDEELRLIWALVTPEDLIEAHATPEDLPQVLELVRTNYSSAQLFMLLAPEAPSLVRGLVKGATPESLNGFASHFREGEMRGDTFFFSVPGKTAAEAAAAVLQKLRAPAAKPRA